MERNNKIKSGVDLWLEKGYRLLWKKDKISTLIKGKEYIICSKNQFTFNKDFDNYNKQITKAYYKAKEKQLI